MIDTTNTTINQVVQDTIDGTKITLDTLYVEIATIKDTLASVSEHTAPTTFLGINSGISNSWIGLFAFFVGCIVNDGYVFSAETYFSENCSMAFTISCSLSDIERRRLRYLPRSESDCNIGYTGISSVQ